MARRRGIDRLFIGRRHHNRHDNQRGAILAAASAMLADEPAEFAVDEHGADYYFAAD
jgi:hypothetical protein